MKTIIINIPEEREGWFITLLKELKVKHAVVGSEKEEEKQLANLIDEAMADKGEVPREQIEHFMKQYGG